MASGGAPPPRAAERSDEQSNAEVSTGRDSGNAGFGIS